MAVLVGDQARVFPQSHLLVDALARRADHTGQLLLWQLDGALATVFASLAEVLHQQDQLLGNPIRQAFEDYVLVGLADPAESGAEHVEQAQGP